MQCIDTMMSHFFFFQCQYTGSDISQFVFPYKVHINFRSMAIGWSWFCDVVYYVQIALLNRSDV